MIQRISLKRERYAEILAKRPVPPWVNEIPEGDFISPWPRYRNGQFLDRFEKKEFAIFCKKKIKYYVFDPTSHGFSKDGVYPVLVFFHGCGNALDGDYCINYAGAEMYASDDYQADIGGAYIIVPVANEYRNYADRIRNKLLRGVKKIIRKVSNRGGNLKEVNPRIRNSWNQKPEKYSRIIHRLLSAEIKNCGINAGPVFLFGVSAGGSLVYKLMNDYTDSYDVAVPCGNISFGDGTVLDKIDEKNNYLFFAFGKRDEFHTHHEFGRELARMKLMKNCFIYMPEWVRYGDKGIASMPVNTKELGQHNIITSIQANLMFDDGTPMDERLPDGMTGWIKQVTQEIINRK